MESKKILEQRHNKYIAKKVKEFREARGITLRELENLTHFTYSYINMVENVKFNPTSFFIWEMSKALNVSPGYFYDDPCKEFKLDKTNTDDMYLTKEDFKPYLDFAKNLYLEQVNLDKANDIIKILK